ncbi:hypothetical protein GCM10027451_37940 [Geodermatophilus aquaeductus]|uniref:Uncharacterized protein n=1 Tax=Geodermatophilus aquaeductus TaxID=1564161 RepID=A0A521FHH2_9ACTN|nr:hypothetical protein [Geodermatophilus aquaeductus]SMO95566.1 hypothetical protein SAMN06273567_1097 [Geodermatophilus aquaeductus]
MSVSGPAIFLDDLACDVRDSYRHLLEDRVPDDEATRRTIVEWQGLDAEEEPVFWLALAATQSRHGRLTDEVRGRALEVIDSGRDLIRWQAWGPGPAEARRAVLASLRTELTGPQPSRRTVRRPWRYVTDLRPGDVLAWTASTGFVVLLRVVQIRETREAATPILERLAWDGRRVPPADVVAQLPGAPAPAPDPGGLHHPGPIFGLFKLKRRDPDWADVGLTRCHSIPARPGDDGDFLLGTSFMEWAGLPTHLERDATGAHGPSGPTGGLPDDGPTVP